MRSYSNFGSVKGCVANPNMPLPNGSCVKQQLVNGQVPEGGCEGAKVDSPGYVNQTGWPPCCVTNPPKDCISTGGGYTSGSGEVCRTPQNHEGRPDTIYDKAGNKVNSVMGCKNCGNYHYSDGIGCFKLTYDPYSNTCVEDKFLQNYNNKCKPINSKSTFGSSKTDPLIVILVVLAILALLYYLLKKRRMFFGKRR